MCNKTHALAKLHLHVNLSVNYMSNVLICVMVLFNANVLWLEFRLL